MTLIKDVEPPSLAVSLTSPCLYILYPSIISPSFYHLRSLLLCHTSIITIHLPLKLYPVGQPMQPSCVNGIIDR